MLTKFVVIVLLACTFVEGAPFTRDLAIGGVNTFFDFANHLGTAVKETASENFEKVKVTGASVKDAVLANVDAAKKIGESTLGVALSGFQVGSKVVDKIVHKNQQGTTEKGTAEAEKATTEAGKVTAEPEKVTTEAEKKAETATEPAAPKE